MGDVRVEASLTMQAPPQVVYAILADYRSDHPAILPRRAFLSLEVEEGGAGAGTVFRCRMKAFGAIRHLRATVSEPAPGRVLVETDAVSGIRTTFDVRPAEEGGGTRVTILTEWKTRGLQGWVEGLVAPRFLRKLYAEELENLARKAESRTPARRVDREQDP